MRIDPNITGNKNAGLFCLPFNEEDSSLVFIPVPWEVTVSLGEGCSRGPEAIRHASQHMDIYDAFYGNFYKRGLYLQDISSEILSRSELLKQKALSLRAKMQTGQSLSLVELEIQSMINEESLRVNRWVYEQAQRLIKHNKFAAVIGGDHSSPFGLVHALSEHYPDLSILHIDAHMDLRDSFQGYQHSHGSIMFNIMKALNIKSLVQVGIRDFCQEEKDLSNRSDRIHTFYDAQISLRMALGENWGQIIREILERLTDNVYISFDIDGLMPSLCPNTGTPVPGGLSFSRIETLLYLLTLSSKKIVGFDLCEVAPQTDSQVPCMNAHIGARILFKMAGALLATQSPG